jgi:Skp family chaperone for outer membrane proteins
MKKVLILSVVFIILLPLYAAWSITLVRVGYIDVDVVVETYTERYLEAEIAMREVYVQEIKNDYDNRYYEMSSYERSELRRQIDDQQETLSLLTYNSYLLRNTGSVRDSLIIRIVQRDIMEAIKKTSELEGFSLVLDNSGNFVYGSEDINLTERVLFRLDEKLLDLQNSIPLAPLELELEDVSGVE